LRSPSRPPGAISTADGTARRQRIPELVFYIFEKDRVHALNEKTALSGGGEPSRAASFSSPLPAARIAASVAVMQERGDGEESISYNAIVGDVAFFTSSFDNPLSLRKTLRARVARRVNKNSCNVASLAQEQRLDSDSAGINRMPGNTRGGFRGGSGPGATASPLSPPDNGILLNPSYSSR